MSLGVALFQPKVALKVWNALQKYFVRIAAFGALPQRMTVLGKWTSEAASDPCATCTDSQMEYLWQFRSHED